MENIEALSNGKYLATSRGGIRQVFNTFRQAEQQLHEWRRNARRCPLCGKDLGYGYRCHNCQIDASPVER